MKHIRLSLILMSIPLLCGCNEENKRLISDNESDAPAMRFYGSIESRADSSDVTKSTLSGTSTDNTRKVLWEPSDSIYVTNGSKGSKFKNITDENNDVAEFLGNIEPGSSYYAFFPYGAVKSYSSSIFQISLPSVQEFQADGIASESFPMVAQCEDNIFEFRNLCGILVLNLTGTQVIDSIRFSGTDEQGNAIKVSGAASVSTTYSESPVLTMGSQAGTSVVLNCLDSNGKGVTLSNSKATAFHIVLPTETYANFTVKIYSSDGNTMTIQSDKPLTIKRSKRTTASNLEYTADKPVYEFVDLGLSVCWATCNVGATKPEGYGDYYAWGETEPKSVYDWSTYKWCNGSSNTLTKYNTSSSNGMVDNKTTLDPEDDVAHVKLGGNWRLPTKAEQDELRNNCTWTWYSSGNSEFCGVAGYKVTSNIKGYTYRFIFLPAGGYRDDESLTVAGSFGGYWSSFLDVGNSSSSFYLGFASDYHYTYVNNRYYGRSVRPVCPSSEWLDNISITLDSNSKSMVQGETCTLSATVKHGNDILNREVTWSSGNPSIASVSETGVVTGQAIGSTTITVTCLGKSATCSIEVTSASTGSYKYVDLGLSVKWATCNVGATKPEEYGGYYAWGETETKSNYDWSTYKWCNGSKSTLTKYKTNIYGIETVLDPEDDVAHVKWGGDWRMPTKEEQDELRNNCTWTWYSSGNSEFGGVAGYKVTGKKSGYTDRFIFLPAAGCRSGTSLYSVGSYGCYWSSSLDTGTPYDVRSIRFYSSSVYANYNDRDVGQSVRPVCP